MQQRAAIPRSRTLEWSELEVLYSHDPDLLSAPLVAERTRFARVSPEPAAPVTDTRDSGIKDLVGTQPPAAKKPLVVISPSPSPSSDPDLSPVRKIDAMMKDCGLTSLDTWVKDGGTKTHVGGAEALPPWDDHLDLSARADPGATDLDPDPGVATSIFSDPQLENLTPSPPMSRQRTTPGKLRANEHLPQRCSPT